MPAYVVLDIAIEDPALYDEYKKLAPSAIAAYGGKYLARGGHAETLEGDWSPNRIVIVQFDSVERAKAMLDSGEYREARALRKRAAVTHSIVVEGA
ncbi:MAG: DUF1330 domain-containing protein [Candidatus Competibacterales bacterium]